MVSLMNVHDPFAWLFYFTLIIAMGMIVFANTGTLLLGTFILLLNVMILHFTRRLIIRLSKTEQ